MNNKKLNNIAQIFLKSLTNHNPRKLHAPKSKRASVLIPLVNQTQKIEVLFTKRTKHLPHHPNQISFPGGGSDPKDHDSRSTAIRETCEEIGIYKNLVKIITRLDQILTVTNFLVTPYLGLINPKAYFHPNNMEVEYLILIPLTNILKENNWRQHEINWHGITFTQKVLFYKSEIIWGATACILINLLNALGTNIKTVMQASKIKKI